MMRSHLRVLVAVLMVTFLIQPIGAAPGFAQAAGFAPVAPFETILFTPPTDALRADAAKEVGGIQVGQPYAGFDLCRGIPATEAAPGRLNASDSTCGDALNPSATVQGGNPPYHFQLKTMGGFPPMGMWVDLNGVLRGTPKNTREADFWVCAVDMSANSDCKQIIISAREAPTARKLGGGGGKAVVALAGLGLAAGGAIYAGKALKDLSNTAGGACASNRFCIVSVMSSGCSCAGSVSGGCDWTGPTVGEGGGCGAGAPCASGLSCNNGRCEGPGGRCPF